MQQGVSIVKASAGSGKTYRLTQDYIDLLLSGDTQRYKHILAVTFTNKATDEMKSRVIEELDRLSRSDDARAPLAADRLRRMLHDYTCFSVSTIDKFFQTVMRSFAREIGQYASYRVELDTDAVLDQVVDLLLDSIEDPAHDALLKWLKDYSFDQVEQGDGWNIVRPLKKMAGQFLDESFLLQVRQAGRGTDVLGDKASLKAFLKKLDGIIRDYEKEAVAIGQEGVRLLDEKGLMTDVYLTKKPGRSTSVFKKWAAGNVDAGITYAKEVDAAIECFPDPSAMGKLFDRVRNQLGEPLRLRNTARLIRKNLYLLGIYSDLQRTLDDYLRENNVVLLQLSTDLLSRIIAEDDTPFVYEKIGNRYEHLMLDEAQDTSLMQWNNFRPLFRNSQAGGGCDLVVGDIKQSIYRWRGSDWRLIRDYLKRDLATGLIREETLKENWRSGSALVAINNDFFLHIGDILSGDAEHARSGAEIKAIYADCEQQVPQKHEADPPGYVRLSFLNADKDSEDSWRDLALGRMIDDIRSLLAEGYDYKDITVLVRTNKDGAKAAAALIEAGISVLTEDSLLIGSSPCIAKLMSLLGWLVDPTDPVAELQSRGLRDNLPELTHGSLYQTCEQLLGCGILPHGEPDLPFIHAFLDAVLAFQEKYGSSLRAFVKWWEEAGHKKSICAPDGQNAVRVMTIHKSKGLSLDAVIIPFCTETYLPRRQPTIWCPCPPALGGPALIPLKASKDLQNSHFEESYEEERTFEHIDVINNWYVAFTRARSRLFIYAPLPKPPGKGKDYSLSCIENTLFVHFKDRLNAKQPCYESGIRDPFVREEKSSSLTDDPLPPFAASAGQDNRLRLALHGEDYFAQEKSARRAGIEQHSEMARVEVDVELEHRSGGRHWFDGTYRVMNEASIVDEHGEIRRPDRVLIAPDGSRVIVIDYKFGQPLSSHHKQVREYVSLLQEMGYPAVEGWLWYVPAGEIVPA